MSVEHGSAADLGGLQPGDRVLALDGVPTGSIDRMHQLLGWRRVGRDVILDVLRRTPGLERRSVVVRPSESAPR